MMKRYVSEGQMLISIKIYISLPLPIFFFYSIHMNNFKNMGQLPKGEARRYGGECVQLVSLQLFALSNILTLKTFLF